MRLRSGTSTIPRPSESKPTKSSRSRKGLKKTPSSSTKNKAPELISLDHGKLTKLLAGFHKDARFVSSWMTLNTTLRRDTGASLETVDGQDDANSPLPRSLVTFPAATEFATKGSEELMTRYFLDTVVELLARVQGSAGSLGQGLRRDRVRKTSSPTICTARDASTQTELRRSLRRRSAPPALAAYATRNERKGSSLSRQASKNNGAGENPKSSQNERDGSWRKSSRSEGDSKSRKSSKRSSQRSGKRSSKDGAGSCDARSGRVVKTWRQYEDRYGLLSSRHPKGLENHGSDCYRSALLQVLLHQPAFAQYLLNVHPRCSTVPNTNPLHPGWWKNCTVCTLQALNQYYWHGQAPANYFQKNPNDNWTERFPASMTAELTNALRLDSQKLLHAMTNDIAEGRQSDPFDLLGFLLDLFQQIEDQDRHDHALQLSLSHPSRPPDPEEVPPVSATDLFTPHIRRSWTCADCGTTSTRPLHRGEFGHGAGVAVNLTKPERGPDLLDLLRNSCFTDSMDIQCQSAACLSAHRPIDTPRHVTFTLLRAPEILVVKLNWFSPDTGSGSGRVEFRKAPDARVAYAEIWDLAEFTETPGTPLRYRLDGVVCHRGDTVEYGHYAAAVRQVPLRVAGQAQGEEGGQTFCLIDDANIGRFWGGTVKELLEPRDGFEVVNSKGRVVGHAWDPYLLVYGRLD